MINQIGIMPFVNMLTEYKTIIETDAEEKVSYRNMLLNIFDYMGVK